eukprot:TRINITY_DN6460_c0_g1_i2.p1 TRINITY_DN6460_c0_g1~~TRINITY_DN6460_c0_g1_i2.p1  ORF type:complete len:495 (+),score=95.60 TRINITY_DN6460_c0_g1_i2:87-1571(+)
MSLLAQQVRVRFAPSPTGYLHLGALRTALFNYLFAKQNNGQFILRIEDTDKTREVPGSAKHIADTLLWAGLKFDEGPIVGGEHGPYTQSERLHLYHHHANDLIKKGHAYRCFCTPDRLESMREDQRRKGLATLYDKFCLRLSDTDINRNMQEKRPHTVRLNVNQAETTVVDDSVFGTMKVMNSFVDDQILLKSDGFPTYHLANVVDDHLMKISHVIRGEEWLPSAAKHVMLYKAFGWEAPKFVHIPLLLNSDGSKLSKRQGDVSVISYQEKGFLPEAMINFVAFLGWTPRDETQILSMSELLKQFSLDRIHKAGAIVDFQKLRWINSQYLRQDVDNNPSKYAKKLEHRFQGAYADSACKHLLSQPKLAQIVHVLKDRAVLEHDFVDLAKEFFSRPSHTSEQFSQIKDKIWTEQTDRIVDEFVKNVSAIAEPDFQASTVNAIIQRLTKEMKITKRQILPPLRLLLTGGESGPTLHEIVAILGKAETLIRLTSREQ